LGASLGREIGFPAQVIWDRNDPWNQKENSGIETFLARHCLPLISTTRFTLNAGFYRERYAGMLENAVNLDLFLERGNPVANF